MGEYYNTLWNHLHKHTRIYKTIIGLVEKVGYSYKIKRQQKSSTSMRKIYYQKHKLMFHSSHLLGKLKTCMVLLLEDKKMSGHSYIAILE